MNGKNGCWQEKWKQLAQKPRGRQKKASSPGSKSRPVGAAIPMHLAMKHPALSTLYLHSLLDSDLKR